MDPGVPQGFALGPLLFSLGMFTLGRHHPAAYCLFSFLIMIHSCTSLFIPETLLKRFHVLLFLLLNDCRWCDWTRNVSFLKCKNKHVGLFHLLKTKHSKPTKYLCHSIPVVFIIQTFLLNF